MDCESCLRDDIKVPSTCYCSECEERLCEECRKHHRRNKLTAAHTIRAVDTGVTCPDKQTAAILKEIKTSCERHKTRTIEYVCVTDRVLCCTYCVIQTHRKCETVLTLAEYKNSSEFHQEAATRHRMLTEIRINSDDVKRTSNAVIESVAQEKVKFETCLQSLLSQITKKATAMFNNNSSINSLDRVNKLAENYNQFQDGTELAVAEKHGTIAQEIVAAFKMSSVLEPQYAELKKGIQFLGQLQETEIEVNTNGILQAIEENFNFKKLCLIIGSRSLQSVISVETPNQARKCIFIGKNVLLACSRNESTLLSVDVELGNQIASVDLKSFPWDIAKRDDSHLLVTLPLAKKIVQINFRQTKLEASFIETKTAFYCIEFCSKKNIFVVSSKETGNFYFISWSGSVLKEIAGPSLKTELVGYGAFHNKTFSYVDDIAITSNNELIFASATKMSKIFVFDFDGALKQVYTHPSIERPMGITKGPDNSMLICSYGNHQVHELRASDCSHRYCSTRSILTHNDGLRGPVDVCYNASSNQLAVCEEDACREIKIFKMD